MYLGFQGLGIRKRAVGMLPILQLHGIYGQLIAGVCNHSECNQLRAVGIHIQGMLKAPEPGWDTTGLTRLWNVQIVRSVEEPYKFGMVILSTNFGKAGVALLIVRSHLEVEF